MAARSLPASGSLKPTAVSLPPVSSPRKRRRWSRSPKRCTVQAAMPCEVMIERSELHRVPTYAVSSPLSRLLSPRPPWVVGTCAQSSPSAPRVRSRSRGSSPVTSQWAARVPTSPPIRARSSARPSGIAGRSVVLEAEHQGGHAGDGAEVVELEVGADDGDVVGVLQVDDELHREHRGDHAGGEQVLVELDVGLDALGEEAEDLLLEGLGAQRGARVHGHDATFP